MRAKRSQEVKQLETAVNRLQDRNQALEQQNREYAKTMQQLQEEMRSLKTQMQQGSLAAALSHQQQQQSSSEVHQVRGTIRQREQGLVDCGGSFACCSGVGSCDGRWQCRCCMLLPEDTITHAAAPACFWSRAAGTVPSPGCVSSPQRQCTGGTSHSN